MSLKICLWEHHFVSAKLDFVKAAIRKNSRNENREYWWGEYLKRQKQFQLLLIKIDVKTGILILILYGDILIKYGNILMIYGNILIS